MRIENRYHKHVLDLKTQAVLWSLVIDNEAHFVKLISLIIDAEIYYAIAQADIDFGYASLFSKDQCINVRYQATHAYHALYWGALDEVVIK